MQSAQNTTTVPNLYIQILGALAAQYKYMVEYIIRNASIILTHLLCADYLTNLPVRPWIGSVIVSEIGRSIFFYTNDNVNTYLPLNC